MLEVVEKSIGELFDEFINGYAFKSDSFVINKKSSSLLPVLKINNVGKLGITDFSNCHYHKFEGYDKFIANAGDLAFSLTGSLGYVSVVSERCLVNQRVFVIKRENKYAELLDVIQPIIKSEKFTKYCFSLATSESNKNISPSVILNYKIPVYINSDGSYNLEAQKKLAEKYQNVYTKRNILLSKIEKLKKIKISFDDENPSEYKMIHLNDMVKHCNGNAKYTKTWCNSHKGVVPLYSANNTVPLAYTNIADFDGEFLTYSKNGCAGYITIVHGKFSINGDRCVLKMKNGYERIDLTYLKFILEPIFRNNKKGRIGINGKNEYTKLNSTMIKKLNITVPIPITDDGEFDLEKQHQLAHRYELVETLKSSICQQIQNLTKIIIE